MAQTEFLSPGVYGLEVNPRRAQEGISPAKMGIIGWTEQGPTNLPIEVRSVTDFTNKFGPINPRGLVAISMRAFFGNGGQRAWVVRVVPADATTASVNVDAPTKWTFTANGAGLWGNDLRIRIEGNRNFLDRTPGSINWEKFDLKVLKPTEFDPSILGAAETFEAIQFTDSLASDYIIAAMTDPRNPSQLIITSEAAGGVPTGLIGTQVNDEIIGVGDLIGTTQFTGTLVSAPVLDNTITIVASETQINDQAQSPVPNGILTSFTFNTVSSPILDGSLKLFYARHTPVTNELVTVAPVPNGIATAFTVATGALSDKVHRENSFFRLKYAGASTGPTTLFTVGGAPATVDLSTLIMGALPVHPGTLSIDVTIAASTETITDDGAGVLSGTGGSLPGGGTINYDTGAMTGITAALDAASNVDETHRTSSIITKAASADNLALGVALVGAVGVGTNTIDLVNSVTTPTDSGPISFVTSAPIPAATGVYLDFVRLGVVNSSIAGVLSNDVGVGTNTVNFTTGAVNVTLAAAARTGTTIDADYQTGQIVTDDGLGNLIGDVDAAGNNTIDYETGAFDVTFAAPPLNGTNIYANYFNLPHTVEYQLAGGANGTAVARGDITDPTLEDDRLGIYAFDNVEEPLNMVVPDFEGSEFVQADIVDFCEARNTRFAILGFANGTDYLEAIKYVLVDQAFNSRCAAIYWPNIYFVNELNNRPELIPCTPFVAGVYARTAFNKNVGKAPAGIEDGALDANGIVGPEFANQIRDVRIRNDLYQSRINPLLNSDATGFVVWGARSLALDIRWRYINARLLHNFLMDAVARQILFAVFENNGPQLWIKIESSLKGFFGSLFRQGYFAGQTEEQAFFVVCNATNNDQASVDAGIVRIDIGFSPNKPAEFLVFTLSQPASTTTV